MITLQKTGHYRLIETSRQTKILYLNTEVYAWVEPPKVGELLVISHKVHKTDCILAIGRYNLYEVDDEPNLSDETHLELEVGGNHWQGYLLPHGLPNKQIQKRRIIPSNEVITGNLHSASRSFCRNLTAIFHHYHTTQEEEI